MQTGTGQSQRARSKIEELHELRNVFGGAGERIMKSPRNVYGRSASCNWRFLNSLDVGLCWYLSEGLGFSLSGAYHCRDRGSVCDA